MLRGWVAAAACAAVILCGCAAPVPPIGSEGLTGPSGSVVPSPAAPGSPDAGNRNSFPGCVGNGKVQFSNSPMRAEDYVHLLPYGLMVGAHVTPIDHMYFGPPQGSQRDQFEVRAIADGVIYSLQPRDLNVDANKPKAREWRMDIAHTCDFHSYFDLLTSLEPSLEAAWNQSRGMPWVGLPVQAGQLVGRIGAQTLDFGVYDYTITLQGFVRPESYSEPWKIHTVDPFPHFGEADRAQVLSRMMRQAEPRAGKIDHDVDGRMIGNWFQVGTGGYGHGGGPRWDYWDGHFAFAPDYLDPTQVRFSIGNWSGQAKQFGIVANAPDPANVGVEEGRIKIELAHYSYLARNREGASGFSGPNPLRPGDDIYAVNQQAVQGVALVQLMEPRLLKLEVFPGKTAADVSDFTSNARMFER